MARPNPVLVVGLAALAYWLLFKPKGVAAQTGQTSMAPATNMSGSTGGGIPGSPYQPLDAAQQAVQAFIAKGGSPSMVI
jgi:hypothetical protein